MHKVSAHETPAHEASVFKVPARETLELPDHLQRLRRRIACASAAAMLLCAGICLAALWMAVSSSGLEAERRTLEEVSNAPFRMADTDEGLSYVSTGTPSWVRVLVTEDGEVKSIETLNIQSDNIDDTALGATDVAELIALRDDYGSESFSWGGRTWIALWLPADDDAGTGRVYSFLDISEHIASTRMIGVGCFAASGTIALATLVIAWIAAGRALRTVADAEERERAFICAASHELKTPLMAMMANCDVLEAELPSDSPWIENIRAAADDMAARITEMLACMGNDPSNK